MKFVNVAVCRLKTHGKVFCIATYPNTVASWRNKTETNINDVLQTEEIYENLSKAKVAKQADLQKAFATVNKLEICKIILEKGEVQVAGAEREQQLASLRKEIATGVAERCYNPDSNLRGCRHSWSTHSDLMLAYRSMACHIDREGTFRYTLLSASKQASQGTGAEKPQRLMFPLICP